MNIVLPQHVKKCISVLENAGYEAFCVGGAIRDLISKLKTPYDFDVATNCPPQTVCSLFDKTIPTGIKHGTITVIIDGTPIEVTTYRIDGSYTDSRHPDEVLFVGDIKEDLARRDFTVNAIAYNETAGVFDPFDGCGDIKKQVLRTVGDADRRFSEDALRIMRLFRFASQLGFEIEEKTLNSALNKAETLADVSSERIAAELFKMLSGEHLLRANTFFKNGCLSPFKIGACDIEKLCLLPHTLCVRFAALCIMSGADINEVCDALKTDNALRKSAISICDMIRSGTPDSKAGIKQYLSAYGEENFREFLDTIGILCNGNQEKTRCLFEEILQLGEPYLISHLAIGGDEIKALGLKGKEIGCALEELKCAVIENPALNTKETLTELITK